MRKRIKRIAAIILVIILVGLVFLTLYLGCTGSGYFMASLFAMLGFPLLLYAFLYIYRLLH